MTALVFLAGCVASGFALLRLAGPRLSAEERLVAGPAIGLVAGPWLVYLLALAAGRFSPLVWLGAVAALVAVSAAAVRRPALGSLRPGAWFVRLSALLVTALASVNAYALLPRNHLGTSTAVEHVWADLPFHASLVTSFAYRDNMPPMYPLAAGQPLEYPFTVDLLTGLLVRFGLSLRVGFILVNLLVQLGVFLGLAVVTCRLTDSRRAAVLATVLFLFLGNFGFLSLPHDLATQGLDGWLARIPWSYTGEALGKSGAERFGLGLYLGNPMFLFVLPRRAGALGLAVGLAIILLLLEMARAPSRRLAVLTGALVGLLPRVHAHTAIAMAIAGPLWFWLWPGDDEGWRQRLRRRSPTWILMAGVALVVAVPQLLAIGRQTSGFLAWAPGWIGEPRQAFESGLGTPVALRLLVRFWFLNGGLLLLLVAPALRFATRRMRVWYVPFAVLWLLGNLVRTQPLEWDNNNHFVYWQLGTVILVAPLIADLLRSGRLALRTGGSLAVAALTLGGLLSFAYASQQRYSLWSADDRRLTRWIRDHVPPDSLVLTATGQAHFHPVNALSGRQVYMGWAGWFVAHGLDWAGYEDRLRRMYSGEVELMRELGVDYAVVGPFERAFAADAGIDLGRTFDDPALFRPVYRQGPWTVFQLRATPAR